MSRPPLLRFAIVAVMALWIFPGASAMAMGLHVALDDHAHHAHDADNAGGHDLSFAELVQAAMHGHHHPVAHAPDHEHEAIANGTAPVFRSSTRLSVALPVVTFVEEQKEERRQPTLSLRHGPPDPLFAKNCTLLI